MFFMSKCLRKWTGGPDITAENPGTALKNIVAQTGIVSGIQMPAGAGSHTESRIETSPEEFSETVSDQTYGGNSGQNRSFIMDVDWEAYGQILSDEDYAVLERYFPVLREETPFTWTVNAYSYEEEIEKRSVTLDEFRYMLNDEWGDPRYVPDKLRLESIAFCDVDRDGNREVVLCINNFGGHYLILKLENGMYYGTDAVYRGFEALQTNGVYVGSDGAMDNSFFQLDFKEGVFREELLGRACENSYYMGEEQTTDEAVFREWLDSIMSGDVLFYEPQIETGSFSSEASGDFAVQDILAQAPVYETGNRFEVYRTNAEEMDCDYEGDYLALRDQESGDVIYLPDFFGRILDVKVEEGETEIRYTDQQGTEIQEIRIPVCFSSRGGAADVYPYCGEKVLVQKGEELALELEELPRLVWGEHMESGDGIYELAFERTSPMYRKLFWESGAPRADYCLTVRDGTGNIIASQMIVNYPVSYEEAYWLEDFSEDGIADIAFCTDMSIGTDYWGTALKTFIWNGKERCYEYRELPECGMNFCPVWNREEAVMIRPAGPVSDPDCWEMYSIVDGQWQRVRRLEPVEEPDENGQTKRAGYREILYLDGEILEERHMEEKESIWIKSDYTIELFTLGEEWTKVPVIIGGKTLDKVVRRRNTSQ